MKMCKKSIFSVVVQLFVLFIYDHHVVRAQDFGYTGEKGPTHWGEQYNTCKGKHQSPINIQTVSLLYVSMPPLKFVGFKTPPQVTSLTNNGHTVQVKMESEVQPQVSGGPLHGIYEFSQFHFHWGENDTYGSEDTINSHSFPMGIHLVFYKKNYRSARTALDYPDGLTVLSLFYEVSEHDNPAYAEFTDLLGTIGRTDQTTAFTNPPTIFDLIETDFSRYYSYNGSLTTPPCSEVVTWIDFEVPIPLSHDQIAKFRSLRDAEGNKLTHNFRPIQPLNDRIVLANSPHSGDPEYQPKFVDPAPLPPIVFPSSSPTTQPPKLIMNATTATTTTTKRLNSTIKMQTTTTPQSTTVTPISTEGYTESESLGTTTENYAKETPTTVKFSRPVEPLSTTLTPTKTTTSPIMKIPTVAKEAFPEHITELPDNSVEVASTKQPLKAEHHRGRGNGAESSRKSHPLLFLLTTTTTVIFVITTNLVL